MPICKKCSKNFPNKYRKDGKTYNFQRRKYCIECSPYGAHNTLKLENISCLTSDRICKICGKNFISKRRHICDSCNNKKQRQRKKDFIMSLVGYHCWRCGYGGDKKYEALLDMHHIDDTNKKFQLTKDVIATKSHEDIINEAKKCVLLCNRCHMEYHYTDLVHNDEIKNLHLKWKDIIIPKYLNGRELDC